MTKKTATKPKARHRILNLLKTQGPQESSGLAKSLGISAMAVRQHLYDFQMRGWVTFKESPKSMGRPAKVWQLTDQAETLFPDHHKDLLLNFIEGIRSTLGEKSLDQLIEYRAEKQTGQYRAQLDSQKNLKGKVNRLAEMRSQEGYMAEVQTTDSKSFLLIENHCPICRAAQSCSAFCRSELEVFQNSLGKHVRVQRLDHIISGDRCCTYHIQNTST